MNNFVIRYWDDNEISRNKIKAPLIDLESRFPYIDYSEINYKDLVDVNNLKTTCEKINLLILDLLNQKELDVNEKPNTFGLDVLANLHQLKIKMPIIVYSEALDEKNQEIKFTQLKKDYPDVIFIKKSDDKTTEILKAEIIKFILKKLPDQFNLDQNNENELSQLVDFFGKRELNELLEKVKSNFIIPKNESVKLFKMKSGFSGAILFYFFHDNTKYLLKISRDLVNLEKEFENAINFYPKFPSKFFNGIAPVKFYTEEKSAMGIIIKLIEDSFTLFDFIIQSTSKNKVENILNDIYIKNGLKTHYANHIKDEKKSWTYILEKFKNGRYLRIENAYKDLKSLLNEFTESEIKEFIENDYYKNFNSARITHQGYITLNHQDLHSKNILIQDENTPFLIDTGLMDYGYWVFDISRLLVDLFINGIDFEKKEFYDINCIDKNKIIGKKLVNLLPIEYDSINDRFIDALNWLTSNVQNIYSVNFTKWELQLGLMREFLLVSTRVENIPHSKRALSLELAQFSMVQATLNYPS